MVRIGIEVNGIIRDVNKQILKYYVKDINKEFDDEGVDMDVFNLADHLDFGSKKKKHDFMYIDYPYELYGCAKECKKDLLVRFNDWLDELNNAYGSEVEVFFFSPMENALTIQSTYFFLSKTGCRVREMRFPKDARDVWKIADIVVTNNKEVIESRPSDKFCILVENSENKTLGCDVHITVKDFDSITTNFDMIRKLIEEKPVLKNNWFNRMLRRVKNG